MTRLEVVIEKLPDPTLEQIEQAAYIIAHGLFQSNPWARYSSDYNVESLYQKMRHLVGVWARKGNLYCAFEPSDADTAGNGFGKMTGAILNGLPPEFVQDPVPARTQYNKDVLGPTHKALDEVAWPSGMVRDGYQINTIAVGPQHQGKGIGGALLRYACREADEQGLTMTLACQEQRLVSLYRKYGFRVTANGYHNTPLPEDAEIRSLPFYAMYRPAGGPQAPKPRITVKKITDPSPKLIDRAAHIVAEALFEGNPIVRYSSDYKVELQYIDEPRRLAVRSRRGEMYYAFVESEAGAAGEKEDLAGVLCVFPAGPRKEINMDNLPPEPPVLDPKPKRVAYFDDVMAAQLTAHSKQAYASGADKENQHVVSLCVAQPYQGLGVGGALLRQLCKDADEQGVGIVLSCQEEKNVGLYRKYGYDVTPTGYAEISLPSDGEVDHFPIWSMQRPPKAKSHTALPFEIQKILRPTADEIEQAARVLTEAHFEKNALVRFSFAYDRSGLLLEEEHRVKVRAPDGGVYFAYEQSSDGTRGQVLGVLVCRVPGVDRSSEKNSPEAPVQAEDVQRAQEQIQPALDAFRAVAWKPDQTLKGWHFSSFGVHPKAQGKGVGGALVRAALKDADEAGAEVTATTQAQANVTFYGRYGFEIQYHQVIPLPGGAEIASFDCWALTRPPRRES